MIRKGSSDICAQFGDRRTATDNSVITVPGKLASFESKALTNREDKSFVDGWKQTSKGLKSGAIEAEVEMILADASYQAYSNSIEDINEIFVCAEPATLTRNRNSISARLKNAFRTIHLLEEGIEVDEMLYDVDIRNNEQMITASNPWPNLADRLYRYLRNLRHRRNTVRLIFRYLLVLYFILLHGAFFRCFSF
uniref:DDE_Tnp_1 domain-containing protein n=1 Tax=Loa loa TaxID=7209 RepID=A0A1I7VLS3_LOALO